MPRIKNLQLTQSNQSPQLTASTATTYPIVETFHSIQGEGAWFGSSAYFIRLGGCDVKCWFCDTKESWDASSHPRQTVTDLVRQVEKAKPAIVVITGGEPLMHDLRPITKALQKLDVRVHLETSGAHPLSGEFDWITLSPKTFKPPVANIYIHIHELKVVVAKQQDLGWAERQADLVPTTAIKYLQPEWNSVNANKLIFDYVRQNSQWRMSLQTHKLLGVR
ncbi:Radical SAM domain protein [Thalassoporum mexicanum PCC 7367]|uniref:7-carboxy-7-deazaguanine synthase QueE n=1 Tax=Thalassoporum mexicanum TaxID=3457544 RepID=UPI00029FD7A8|nr:7-carboxy-7-deazaguanine synthase QueE [Pseudanabaena sp. PCC 7367]AFY70705.1 Radical SAM domain protein [Pseudanabaena sp. PCC 7367]